MLLNLFVNVLDLLIKRSFIRFLEYVLGHIWYHSLQGDIFAVPVVLAASVVAVWTVVVLLLLVVLLSFNGLFEFLCFRIVLLLRIGCFLFFWFLLLWFFRLDGAFWGWFFGGWLLVIRAFFNILLAGLLRFFRHLRFVDTHSSWCFFSWFSQWLLVSGLLGALFDVPWHSANYN